MIFLLKAINFRFERFESFDVRKRSQNRTQNTFFLTWVVFPLRLHASHSLPEKHAERFSVKREDSNIRN